MNSLKQFYLDILLEMSQFTWNSIFEYLINTRVKRFDPNIITKSKSFQETSNNMQGQTLKRTTSVFTSANKVLQKV